MFSFEELTMVVDFNSGSFAWNLLISASKSSVVHQRSSQWVFCSSRALLLRSERSERFNGSLSREAKPLCFKF
jgi:hypothetical protein